jgi:uncharacterized protein (DUF983 family)
VPPPRNPDSRLRAIGTALRRGISRKCPHCGVGPLFSGWRHIERCSVCGLVFERNAGDTWFFTIVGDRLPVAIGIAVVYFGIARNHRAAGIVAFVLLIALLVWTSPNRWGVGIALHYLSRLFWPDAADPIPSRATPDHQVAGSRKPPTG